MLRRSLNVFAETFAGYHVSASSYRPPENIVVVAIVVSERKLVQVKRKVLLADVVVGANNAAFNQGPERVQCLRVDFTANVLADLMLDSLMRIFPVQLAVSNVIIGCEEFHLRANRFGDELLKRVSAEIFDNAADHISFATDRPNHASFSRSNSARTSGCPLVPMFILFSSANKGFVYLNDSHQSLKVRIGHARPESVAHVQRGRIRAANLPLNLLELMPFLLFSIM